MAADPILMERLRKVLALTTSPVEGEAQAAAFLLQKMLTEHNLGVADLEKKGASAPGVRKQEHDLGKAAFRWKMDLADVIASHYFCHPLVDRHRKTVAFVGRPDNVESLQMLYAWVIDQIKRISSEARVQWQIDNNDHVDPLRWQVNFGVGAVERLGERLIEIRRAQSDEAGTALVIHHKSEISDWLEENGHSRIDGQPTKARRERMAEEERYRQAKRDMKARCEADGDMEPYYKMYPSDRPGYWDQFKTLTTPEKPKTEAQRERERRRAEKEEDERYWRDRRREDRENRREERRWANPEYAKRQRQASHATGAGRVGADRVNLQPFLKDGDTKQAGKLG